MNLNKKNEMSLNKVLRLKREQYSFCCLWGDELQCCQECLFGPQEEIEESTVTCNMRNAGVKP